jgi:hypothetical protein
MLGGAGPSYYSQRNRNGRPNDEFEGSGFMGHREIPAVTSPKRKIPFSVESGNCAKPPVRAWQSTHVEVNAGLKFKRSSSIDQNRVTCSKNASSVTDFVPL